MSAPQPVPRWRLLGRGVDPRWCVATAFLLAFGALLFTRLGHYALWDDEANTALFARGVWQTGDTSAVVGHNVVGYRSGLELHGLKNRLIAPLAYYVAAPFVGPSGTGSLWVRLPFALLALAAGAFAVRWLHRAGAPLRTWVLILGGALGNVSLVLYSRQGRYYALSTLLTLCVVYCYQQHRGATRTLVGLCASALGLLATHYIAYAALAACLGVDYLLFGWRRYRFRWKELGALALSQAAVGAAVIWVWNPLQKPVTGYRPASWWHDKWTLLGWNLRELNACEFGALALLALAPALYLLTGRKNAWLVRVPLAICVYAAAVALASPQPVGWATVADIRYLQATIPGLIFLTAVVLCELPVPDLVRYALGAVLGFTNVAQVATAGLVGGPVGPLRSTPVAFVRELAAARADPYAAAAAWVNQHVPPGKSAWVLPDFATYPLMHHAPHAIYAWQFDPGVRSSFPGLPPIHFRGLSPPDFVVAFGPEVHAVRSLLPRLAGRGWRYEQRAHLEVHWPDLTRPELFWRSFEPVPLQDPSSDGVFVFAKTVGDPEQGTL